MTSKKSPDPAFALPRPAYLVLALLFSILISGCILTGPGNTSPSALNASNSSNGPSIPMQPTVNVTPPPARPVNASDMNNSQSADNSSGADRSSEANASQSVVVPANANASNQGIISNSTPNPAVPSAGSNISAQEAQAREDELLREHQAQIDAARQAEANILSQVSGTAVLDPNGGRTRSKVCAITVSPTRIYAGQESTVLIYANSANNERVTYLCGSEEHLQGYGGIFTDKRICTFDAPGHVRVWLALDGQTCASAPLDVVDVNDLSTPQPACDILAETRDFGVMNSTHTYSAVLEYRNFAPDANLSWNCPYENMSTTLYLTSQDSSSPQSGFLRLDCQYGFDPGAVRTIPVQIDGTPCGDLVSTD